MISINSPLQLSKLTQIIDNLGNFLSDYDLVIDSRLVNSHSIFCAYPGFSNDGRKYIENAIRSGAVAILYEDGVRLDLPILHIGIKNLMYYIGLLAAAKYGNPSQKFHTIGVTGTNGKTSITHWLNQLYTLLGQKSAIIGTTGAGIYPEIKDYESTTPDPITLQKLLLKFASQKIDINAMEVSSHSLHQGRVNGVAFKTAIFTNLTPDHLDYHKTMENYYQAKRDLFYWQGLLHAVVNIDDEYGKRLFNELMEDNRQSGKNLHITTYGINAGDLQASQIKINLQGMSFILHHNGQMHKVMVNVIGKFNVYNILAVIACLLHDGYTIDKILHFLTQISPVCGRMDIITDPNSPLIVVDYAHTPDALQNTLSTLKEVEHDGKLYCVFGCGGNRDTSKRALMGAVATKFADFSYITSDNPRNEEPLAIVKQIEQGVVNRNYLAIPDRKIAIEEAISKAQAGDIILIAGKGHETYQEINGVKYHFSDFEVARSALEGKKVKHEA